MKKLLLVLMLIIPMFGRSQIGVDIGAGYDADTKHVPVEVDLSYTTHRIVPSLSMRFDFTADSYKHTYFGGGIGYNVVDAMIKITPSIGYYWDKVSNDHREYNGWYTGYFLDFATNKDRKWNLYLEAGYIATPQILFGATFKP